MCRIKVDGHYLSSAVAFIRASSLISQLEMFPLMNPEMITNSSTRMLIAVKILLMVVDSFTPNASTPLRTKTVIVFLNQIQTVRFYCTVSSNQRLPESIKMRAAAKTSG